MEKTNKKELDELLQTISKILIGTMNKLNLKIIIATFIPNMRRAIKKEFKDVIAKLKNV